jgi:hypothetical protein
VIDKTGEDCLKDESFKGYIASLLRRHPEALLKISEYAERAEAQIQKYKENEKMDNKVTKADNSKPEKIEKESGEESDDENSKIGKFKKFRQRDFSQSRSPGKKRPRFAASQSPNPPQKKPKINSKTSSSILLGKMKTGKQSELDKNKQSKKVNGDEKFDDDDNMENDDEDELEESNDNNKQKEKFAGKKFQNNKPSGKFSLSGGSLANGERKQKQQNDKDFGLEDEDEDLKDEEPDDDMLGNDEDDEVDVMDRSKIAEFNSNLKSFDWKSNKQEQNEEMKNLGCKAEELKKEDFDEITEPDNEMIPGTRTPLRIRVGRQWLKTTSKTDPSEFDPMRAELDKLEFQKLLRLGKSVPRFIDLGPNFSSTDKTGKLNRSERARRDALINTMRANQGALALLFDGCSHVLMNDTKRALPIFKKAAQLISHNQATAKMELMMAEDKTRALKIKKQPPNHFKIFDDEDDRRSEEVAKKEKVQRDLHNIIHKNYSGYNRNKSSTRFFGSRSPRSKSAFFNSAFNSPQTGRRRSSFQRTGSAGNFRRANFANGWDNNNAHDESSGSRSGSGDWNDGNNNKNKNRGSNARNKSTGRK